MSVMTETFQQQWDRIVRERELLLERLIRRAQEGEGVRIGDFCRLGYEEVFFKGEGSHGVSYLRKNGDKPILMEYESREDYDRDKKTAIGIVANMLEEETTWFDLDPRNHA